MQLFGLTILRKHWALIPVAAICGGACVMCGAYIGYMGVSKGDLSFRPWSWKDAAPYQAIKPTEIRKFMGHHKRHDVNEEITNLRREIGSFKA